MITVVASVGSVVAGGSFAPVAVANPPVAPTEWLGIAPARLRLHDSARSIQTGSGNTGVGTLNPLRLADAIR